MACGEAQGTVAISLSGLVQGAWMVYEWGV